MTSRIGFNAKSNVRCRSEAQNEYFMKWQEKMAKCVNRGLRCMNEFDAQGEDYREQTEISFNLEKVCVQFCTNDKRFKMIGRYKWKTNYSYRIHFYLSLRKSCKKI